jgi:hypothetical protein
LFFRYFQTIDEIIGYLSQIHIEVNRPSIIVIDGLQNYIDQDTDITSKSFKIALIAAHLKDAIEYIQLKKYSKLFF